MGTKNKAMKLKREISNEEQMEKKMSSKKEKAREHMEQLHRLQQKDPEFFQFLQEHDKELLDFNDQDIDDEIETDVDDDEEEELGEDEERDVVQLEDLGSLTEEEGEEEKLSENAITSDMVDNWCNSIRANGSLGALRSLIKAFRNACHCGDGYDDESGAKFSVMPSNVFNKIMLFVLNEMDGILRRSLKLPQSGGKKEDVMNLMRTKQWKNYSHFVKSYLGNALHILREMTNTEMVSFTLRRLRYSSIFLAAFPVLLRKYIKVILHYWTGGGALPVICFLFLRDLCMELGSDCVDECIKGMYKTYVENCHYVNATNLQHIQFLGNCFIELLRVDLPAAYQHAFVFIRQLGMVLRQAIGEKRDGKKKKSTTKKEKKTEQKKDLYRKVYEWKYINCLELWTGAICTYNSDADLRPLAYPLTQLITGAARLLPTAQYFPLRLRCIRMLNRIGTSTGTFIPVSPLLVDMLEMKELHRPPTGGVGNAVDLRTILKVGKNTLKTRAFQEACVFTVVEELTEHLAQWSLSVTFFELSFIPVVRLRNFCKSTKVERFRREMRQLIRQIEANCEFTNKKRVSVTFLPNDPAAASKLEADQKSGASPLSTYAATLRQRARQRNDSLMQSSVLVGERSSVFGEELDDDDENDDESRSKDGASVFSSSWLPRPDSRDKHPKPEEKKEKRKKNSEQYAASDEDIVEDLVLSDEDEDEDEDEADSMDEEVFAEDDKPDGGTPKQQNNKRKFSSNKARKKGKPSFHKQKKRKGEN